MTRLFLRITLENLLAIAIFAGGVWLIGRGDTVSQVLAVIAMILAFLLLTHSIMSAARGKVRTPQDFGAGHRVPGTPTPAEWKAANK